MIVHASCLELPPDMIAGCDVMITDPPYSEHVHKSASSTRTGGAGPRKRDFGFVHLSPELRDAIAGFEAQMRRWSVVFCDHEGAHEWRESMAAHGVEYIRQMPWVRWSQPQITGDRPPTGSEAVLHFCRPDEDADSVVHFHCTGPRCKPIRKRWNGPGGLTHYAERCLRGEGKHPTEKPLDLMLTIVSAFSDPGEVVFDPCAGAGTTALAARLLGRGCLATELDATWAERAAAREVGALVKRDADRAAEWIEKTLAEARTVAKPENDNDLGWPSWRRAQARIADAERVAAALVAGRAA